jgi:hypothetical protein
MNTSSRGTAAATAGSTAGSEPWRTVLATASRIVIGAGTVALGLVFLPLGVQDDIAVDVPFLIFATVFTIGGATLLALPRLLPASGLPERLAGAVVTLAGLLTAGLLPVRQPCCDAAYTYSWGLPLPWATGGGDTRGEAAATVWTGPVHVDTVSAVGDVLFWAYAGLLVLVVVGATRRALRDRVGARP